MIFDLPTNMTRVTEILAVANTYTGGYLGLIILIICGFGVFLLTSQFNSRESIIASTFITFILSLFLWMFGLLGAQFVWGTIILFIVGLVIGFTSKGTGGA